MTQLHLQLQLDLQPVGALGPPAPVWEEEGVELLAVAWEEEGVEPLAVVREEEGVELLVVV